MANRHYDMEWELQRGMSIVAAAQELDVQLGAKTVAELQALLDRGRAAAAAAAQADPPASVANTQMRLAVQELAQVIRSVRTIGQARFKSSHPDVAKEYGKLPQRVTAPEDVLAAGREADSVWAITPAAATYEPLPGMTRTDFQTKLQTVEALFQPAAEAKKAAAMAAAEAQAVAKEMHEAWVAWLKEARAVYRQGTPQRALLDGIETEKGGPSTPKPQLPPGV
jgi:hypothetical protein